MQLLLLLFFIVALEAQRKHVTLSEAKIRIWLEYLHTLNVQSCMEKREAVMEQSKIRNG